MKGRSEFLSPSSSNRAGVRLHALRWGDASAPVVVLLHGGGANAHWWDHLAPGLAHRFQLVAPDFRGHGDSDYPEETSVGGFQSDLEAVLEHLGTAEVFLVGHSMGGHVALDHASRHEGIRGLVAIDPARGGSHRSRRSTRLALTFRRSYASREEAEARYRFYPPAERAAEALRASVAARSVGPDAGERWGYKFDPRWFAVPPRPAPDLSAIRCPTRLIRGAESPLLSEAGAREMAAEIPGAELVEIAEAGHHVQMDQPEAVLASLQSFLGGLL
ncbi:MAG: alpha/beta hydrolase [Proteobacteria bacterium]|nr:alpha/beta hydrolase [Pseudomonadota bacterium]